MNIARLDIQADTGQSQQAFIFWPGGRGRIFVSFNVQTGGNLGLDAQIGDGPVPVVQPLFENSSLLNGNGNLTREFDLPPAAIGIVLTGAPSDPDPPAASVVSLGIVKL